jgi:non-ribosomal peptide synthase protein (TIGR01720 family)
MEWTYSDTVHAAETIQGVAERFIDGLRALITHCQSPEAGGYTPSDFPDVSLSEDDIEALMGEISQE